MKIPPIAADGTIQIQPIGFTCSSLVHQKTGGLTNLESSIELRPEFTDYLAGLEQYSHLLVIYWLSEMTETQAFHRPQGNPDVPVVGIFACR